MPRFSTIETDFLVLRKTEYSETSLILAGLSPEHGQLHFLARGARKVGRKSFPVADLFRVLRVKYAPGKSDLNTWRDVELACDYTHLVHSMNAYRAACWLAGFTLQNTMGGTPAPRFYDAVKLAFDRLQKAASSPVRHNQSIMLAPVICAGVIYLDENGLLPDYRDDPAARQRRDVLLGAGEGRGEFPRIAPASWNKLFAWLKRILTARDCRLPDTQLLNHSGQNKNGGG